jgi:hypothetical protein
VQEPPNLLNNDKYDVSKATLNLRWLVIGPSRSGTTLLASLLSRLGICFGVKDRDWNIDSGYYEHPQALRAYGHVRKWNKLTRFSDNISGFFRDRAIECLEKALRDVDGLKYPPLSSDLPFFVKQAGFEPRLAISLRSFDTYALSRMRKEGVDWVTCKEDYINIYQTALFNLHLYGGTIFCYEDLWNEGRSRWLPALMAITGANEADAAAALEACVKKARHQSLPALAQEECDALYQQLLSCR